MRRVQGEGDDGGEVDEEVDDSGHSSPCALLTYPMTVSPREMNAEQEFEVLLSGVQEALRRRGSPRHSRFDQRQR